MYHLLSSFFELFATFSVYYCQTGVIRLVPWTVLNQVLISAKNPFYKTYYHMVCVLPFTNLTTMCFFLQNFWSSTKIKKLKLQRTWRMVLFNIKTDNFPPLLQPVYSLSEFLSSVSEWLPALQNLEKPGKIIAAVTIMDLNQGPACSPHSCCCSCQCSSGDGDGDGDGNGDDESDDYAALLVMLMLMVNLDLQSSKLVQLPI